MRHKSVAPDGRAVTVRHSRGGCVWFGMMYLLHSGARLLLCARFLCNSYDYLSYFCEPEQAVSAGMTMIGSEGNAACWQRPGDRMEARVIR
ncbi:hypothetical protein [Vibrio aerogenes]|uniref:hypothetical protein n=1 Tax=Vibrio aerogenes TaxID=92172 RepID=UPI001114FA84|nr:hypothetical protein [Vibrio aerogenes]